MPDANNGSPILRGMDMLSRRVVSALNGLFGFQYSRNAEHYIYGLTITTGTADALGTSYSSAIRITQEADFIATRLNAIVRVQGDGSVIGMSTNAAAAGDWPDVPHTILITDGSTDRQLSNQAVDFLASYGQTGGWPGVWARPRLFARNSTITFQLVSLKAVPSSTVWNIRLSLIGWKIYDAQALDLTSRA